MATTTKGGKAAVAPVAGATESKAREATVFSDITAATISEIKPEKMLEMMKRERDLIIRLSKEYEITGDTTVKNDINKLNIHYHAKVAVLAHELESKDKDAAAELEKYAADTNSAIIKAARSQGRKINWIDIRGTTAVHNGKEMPIHEHLHGHLFKNDDVTNVATFADPLGGTKLKEEMNNINIDEWYLAEGESNKAKNPRDVYGLIELKGAMRD